jgi:hypothetical protein
MATLFERSAGTIAANSVPTVKPPAVADVTFNDLSAASGIKKPEEPDPVKSTSRLESVS